MQDAFNVSIMMLLLNSIIVFASQTLQLFSDKKYQLLQQEYGAYVTDRLDDWKQLVEQNLNRSDYEKLQVVNNFFNQTVHWIDDNKLWNKKDYWATPLETLIKAAGDCEDFSIAKYYTLQALGIPVEKLKITYVNSLQYNQAHMVLSYYPTQTSDPLILDNINQQILSGSQRSDLQPIYSFNGEAVWLSEQKRLGNKLGDSNKIRLWSNLIGRIKRELEE